MPTQLTPTTSIRTATVARLLELIERQDGLDAVQITDGAPVDLQNECIFVGDLIGTIDVPVMAAGVVRRNDVFTVSLHIYAGRPGQVDARTARERCEALIAIIEAMLRTNPSLDNLSTLPYWALEVSLDGPDPRPSHEGWVAYALMSIEVTARLR